MYVRPHHIPLVNQLAREFFWPGIDREFIFTFYKKSPSDFTMKVSLQNVGN
jgi:hypothetical protein